MATWEPHDIAPLPLAVTFDAPASEKTWGLYDVAPIPLATQFDSASSPWTETWWGGPLSIVLEAQAGGAPQTIQPSTILSGETFGTPLVHQQVLPATIASAESFGVPVIQQQVRPSTIASAEAFGSPSVHQQVRPATITSAEAFGIPTILLQLLVKPDTIPSEESFGVLTIHGGAEPEEPHKRYGNWADDSPSKLGAPTILVTRSGGISGFPSGRFR